MGGPGGSGRSNSGGGRGGEYGRGRTSKNRSGRAERKDGGNDADTLYGHDLSRLLRRSAACRNVLSSRAARADLNADNPLLNYYVR
jgi:hypothetical protein